MLKSVTLYLIAAGAATPVVAACDLDCSLEKGLREEGLAGAVYSLVDGDGTRMGAVGFANHDSRQPMRTDSKVHIGSVNKTLMAMGVLRLATQGRVSLDAPVSKWLPDVPIQNPWQSRAPVTLRHLLDHTAGLEDLRLWQLFSLKTEPQASLREMILRTPGQLRVRTEPGTRFSYSNLSYTLVGMVIEAVTGERYESWLDRELLRPLGMNDSTFEFVSQMGPAADPRLAWGHLDDLNPVAAQPVAVRPATQVTTTAADMARVARFLMSDGRVGEVSFIDRALLRQMGRAHTRAAAAGVEVGYALGLATRDRDGAVGLCHLGGIVGYRATLCLYPEQGKALFLAINSDNESARYARFDELLTRSLGVSTPVMPAVDRHAAPGEWQGRYVLSPARFEQFRYFDLLLDSMKVRAAADGLSIQRFGGDPQLLVPVGRQLYRGADRTRASHALLVEDGSRFIIEGTRTLRWTSEWQFIANWMSLGLGVAGLIVFLLLIPWRAWRRDEPWLQPATVALLLLLVPAPLFAMQPFMALGDVTPASLSLYLAMLALPLLMLAQAAWGWRKRARLKSWRVHALAAALVLQWCASLYTWDLLPLALWR